jgi:23S rRNA (uracil1939-C5)-methyltransferase
MSYGLQLEQKVSVLQETLRRIGGLEGGDVTAVPSADRAYRIRVRLHRSTDGGFGFMEHRSDRVIPVDGCPICVEPINRVISRGMRDGSEVSASEPSPDTLTLLATDHGVVSDQRREFPGLWEVITVAGRPIRCSAETFFQSNLSLLPQLVAFGIDGLSGGRVLDLFCGVGLFGCFLADRFDEVISVDRDPRAVALARENVQGARHRFYTRSVQRWVRRGPSEVTAVLVDPARPGLAEPIVQYLRSCSARQVVYVSCNPVTLARDLALLCHNGSEDEAFTIREIRLFDLFPQTHHMEIVVRLSREPGA